ALAWAYIRIDGSRRHAARTATAALASPAADALKSVPTALMYNLLIYPLRLCARPSPNKKLMLLQSLLSFCIYFPTALM
ncbi:MAG: hypothetical protein K2G07_04445, partial [Muribaculaceae bacterium]|nr:hypothetical protein [Muribaculaceae bacterium]